VIPAIANGPVAGKVACVCLVPPLVAGHSCSGYEKTPVIAGRGTTRIEKRERGFLI